MTKIAYLHKNRAGYVLTICDKPCGGEEFNKSKQIQVSGKTDARDTCRAMGVKPYNF